MTNRNVSVFLAFMLLASTVSCGAQTCTEDTTGDQTTDTATTAESNKFDDGLPDKKFDGRTITFGVSTASESDIIAEEENGDIVNDTIVARNRAVEERFDVKLESYIVSDDLYDWYDKLSTLILAGDDVCDLAGHYAYYTYKAVQKGLYQD